MAAEPATESETEIEKAAPKAPEVAIPKKTLIWIGVITAAVWAFAISTGSTVFMLILGVLTALLACVLLRAHLVSRRGIPSRRRQIRTTVAAFSSTNLKPGSAALARATN